jgi:hypothetical protein
MYTNDMKRLSFFLIPLFIFLTPAITLAACIEGDCLNGQGTITYSSGTKYVGGFKDGNFNGQGIITYSSGKKYVGEFKDGKKHGQGTMTHSDGEQYAGEWKNGKIRAICRGMERWKIKRPGNINIT